MTQENVPEFPPPSSTPAFEEPAQQPQQFNQAQPPQQPYFNQPLPVAIVDSGSFGWAVLGFFIPLVGLILFLVWKDSKPLSAKKAGIGALVGVIVSIILSIIYVACFAALLGGIASTGTVY